MATVITHDKTFGNPTVDQNQLIVDVFITLSGNYGTGASNGDILSFANTNFIQSRRVPIWVDIYEEPLAGNAPSGYTFVWAVGTTQANGQLIVLQGGAAVSSPQAQYTQGSAYSGALTGARLKARAVFALGN